MPQKTFFQRAATYCLLAPLAVAGLGIALWILNFYVLLLPHFSTRAYLYLSIAMLLAGMCFGIISLFGLGRPGKIGILCKILPGILITAFLCVILVSSYLRVSRVRNHHALPSDAMVMADSPFLSAWDGNFFAPPGYNYVLWQFSGPKFNAVGDPGRLAHVTAGWKTRPLQNLRFFEAELDSPEPIHVKAGILSIAILSRIVDLIGPAQVSEQDRAAFSAAFPNQKINTILAQHPEYAEWLAPLRGNPREKLFPSLKLTFEEQEAAPAQAGK